MAVAEGTVLRSLQYEALIVDEGHRYSCAPQPVLFLAHTPSSVLVYCSEQHVLHVASHGIVSTGSPHLLRLLMPHLCLTQLP